MQLGPWQEWRSAGGGQRRCRKEAETGTWKNELCWVRKRMRWPCAEVGTLLPHVSMPYA